jgi:hypothetical protein
VCAARNHLNGLPEASLRFLPGTLQVGP